jgi:hypothetical protein|tara:strand:+ start:1938 stop:2816 length:879 start_codon:yes stop_codon:yes gene_type:complete
VRGEDVFRFGDSERQLAFHPSNPEVLNVLRAEQIEQFNRTGYLTRLPGLEHDEIVELRHYLNWLIEEVISANDRRNSYSINQYHQVCGPLWDLIHTPIFVHYVTDILGSEVVCWSTHMFCKLPGDGMEVPLHQDANYWPFTPTKSVTIWLAIDDVDRENSAMHFVPGSHLIGDLRHDELPLDGSVVLNRRVVDHETYDTLVSNELDAGQVSLHTDLLLHGSLPNSSNRRRCGIALRYLAADVRTVRGGESWTQSAVHIENGDPSGYWPNRLRPLVDEPHKMARFLGGFDGNT